MTRHPLLTGFLLAIFLFAAIVCTATTVYLPTIAQSLNIGAAPNRSWAPPPTATPTLTPIPSPTPTLPIATLPPNLPTPLPGTWTFQPGDIAVVVNNGPVNMRRTPGYKNKSASDRVALVPARARVAILSGPARVDGLVWWYVDWNGAQGWMAERSSGGKILLTKTQ